jgi:hypothetical protein
VVLSQFLPRAVLGHTIEGGGNLTSVHPCALRGALELGDQRPQLARDVAQVIIMLQDGEGKEGGICNCSAAK